MKEQKEKDKGEVGFMYIICEQKGVSLFFVFTTYVVVLLYLNADTLQKNGSKATF